MLALTVTCKTHCTHDSLIPKKKKKLKAMIFVYLNAFGKTIKDTFLNIPKAKK